MKIKKNKIKHRQKTVVFGVFCAIVTIGIAAFYLYYIAHDHRVDHEASPQPIDKAHTAKPDSHRSTSQTEAPKNDKAPPATDHAQATPQIQGNISAQMTASVVLNDDALVIRGGINTTVVEGSCFAEITNLGGETTRYTTDLLRNAATTDCKTIIIPRTQLSSGTWKVTLHYSSPSIKGVSDAHTITIN